MQKLSRRRSVLALRRLNRAIWIHATDLYGAKATYQVSVVAFEDRPERYSNAAVVADAIAPSDLHGVLERAAALVTSWSARDLQRPMRTT